MTNNVPEYFKNERRTIAVHIPQGAHRVLDVGCGAGNFGHGLKRNGQAQTVHGIELFQSAADEAATKLDGVICANLDTIDLQKVQTEWSNPIFDYIVFADVLEHLKDPWGTLNSMLPFLAPNGTVIISLPNIRHWTVIFPLIFDGRWDYRSEGIMDKTHLRFFTRSTAEEMIAKAELRILSRTPLIGGRWKTISKLLFRTPDEFLAIQYVFVAKRV